MTFDMQYALEHFTDILQAAPVAIWVTVFSAFLGLLGGAIFCTIRLNSIPLLSTIIGLLVSLIRSTPILVQLYVVCYGMPPYHGLAPSRSQTGCKCKHLPKYRCNRNVLALRQRVFL